MVAARRALGATSIFIGMEAARFDPSRFAEYERGVSVITLGELRLGVLQASGPEASAVAHNVPIVTQDRDYDAMPDVEIITVP